MNKKSKVVSEDVLDRLKILLGTKADKDLALFLGISPANVSAWKTRNTIPYDICVEIATERNISLDWLILGIGPSGDREIDSKYVSTTKQAAEIAYVSIPMYDITAKAKPNQIWNGAGVVTELKYLNSWVLDEGLAATDLMAMTVIDDCMAPTLKYGDVMVINRQKKTGDGVFLVRVGSELKVKRLQWLMDGLLKIASDNLSYQEEVVAVADLTRLGFEVVGECHSRQGRLV